MNIALIFILVQQTVKICRPVSFLGAAVSFTKCAHYAQALSANFILRRSVYLNR